MLLEAIATLCAGLFSGAAIYVSVVEHPARLSCGTRIALTEFAPSYHRGALMQASLAVAGLLAAVAAWLSHGDVWPLVGGLTLGGVVPFTLLVIAPINKRLLSSAMDADSQEAASLLKRWGRLHGVRSLLGLAAFLILLLRFARSLGPTP